MSTQEIPFSQPLTPSWLHQSSFSPEFEIHSSSSSVPIDEVITSNHPPSYSLSSLSPSSPSSSFSSSHAVSSSTGTRRKVPKSRSNKRGKVTKKSKQNGPPKARKNDDSKKAADLRWRRTVSNRFDDLRKLVEQDINFYDETVITGKCCKSKNDVITKTLDLIGDLKNKVTLLCTHPCEALTPSDRLSPSKKFIKKLELLGPEETRNGL